MREHGPVDKWWQEDRAGRRSPRPNPPLAIDPEWVIVCCDQPLNTPISSSDAYHSPVEGKVCDRLQPLSLVGAYPLNIFGHDEIPRAEILNVLGATAPSRRPAHECTPTAAAGEDQLDRSSTHVNAPGQYTLRSPPVVSSAIKTQRVPAQNTRSSLSPRYLEPSLSLDHVHKRVKAPLPPPAPTTKPAAPPTRKPETAAVT